MPVVDEDLSISLLLSFCSDSFSIRNFLTAADVLLTFVGVDGLDGDEAVSLP